MNNSKQFKEIFKPKSISEIIGQTHILSNDSLIIRMIKNKHIYSLIFYGPPGIGKTSMAICLANDLDCVYEVFNASVDNKERLIELINKAVNNEKFILIIDEIHSLNKNKQDILLPFAENGSINIFATTTENPYFKINPSVRSRMNILQLKPIDANEMFIGLKRVISKLSDVVLIDDEEIKFISNFVNGDLRSAINVVDIIYNLYAKEKITKNLLANILNKPIVMGAHYGDEIHDLKSAFHKSLRGSDVDASLHYLARLIAIEALDDISRRMLCTVYEDVGLANPNLALRVSTGIESCYRLGFPEARIILSSLCIQIAKSKKSNSAYIAITQAIEDLNKGNSFPIPNHLRDSHYSSAVKLGVTGYKYPHDFSNSFVNQQYLPTNLIGTVYYKKKNNSEFESNIDNWLIDIKK
ncbi:MAG: replication-associated recombination protein A [Mycoplasma sp.]